MMNEGKSCSAHPVQSNLFVRENRKLSKNSEQREQPGDYHTKCILGNPNPMRYLVKRKTKGFHSEISGKSCIALFLEKQNKDEDVKEFEKFKYA